MMILWILAPIALHSALAKRHAPADFESLSKDPLYIDKTLLLHRYLESRRERYGQVITCPAGFMKSTNLDMIKRFVQIEVDDKGQKKPKNQTRNFRLFNNEKFAIKQYDLLFYSHLAEYPVVHLELGDVEGPTIRDIFIKMSAKIRKCYREYEWLYKLYEEKFPDDYYPKNCSKIKIHKVFMRNIFQYEELPAVHLQNSTYKLIDTLHYYFNKKVIVLIDDFDAPLIKTAANKDHHTALNLVVNVLDQVIGTMFNPDTRKHIESVLLLATNSVPLGLENGRIVYNPFLKNGEFSQHFAITEDEISAKLAELNYENSSQADIKAKFGGYISTVREPIFCKPDSIMRFLKNQSSNNDTPAADSWIDSGSLSALSVFLNNTKIRTKIEKLINGSDISFLLDRPVDILHYQKLDAIIRGLGDVDDFDASIFFTILLENGYLTYNLSKDDYLAPLTVFKAPNEEAREAFKNFYSLYKQ